MRSGDSADEALARLSAQERRILACIAEGLTNRQIADRLSLAEKTVKNYVSSLLDKLGLQRRTQAAVFATRIANRAQATVARATALRSGSRLLPGPQPQQHEDERRQRRDAEQSESDGIVVAGLVIRRAHHQRREVTTQATGRANDAGDGADPFSGRALGHPGKDTARAQPEEERHEHEGRARRYLGFGLESDHHGQDGLTRERCQ